MQRCLALTVAAVFALAACRDSSAPVEPPSAPELARSVEVPVGRAIPDQYIVVLGPDVTDVDGTARQLARDFGGRLRFTYRHALEGFAIRLPEPAVAALSRDPRVAYVEQDQIFTIVATQSNATWGLDRIDQRALPLSTTYEYTTTGAGVTGYIIDTGIRFDHAEFGGRAVSGYDFVSNDADASDCHGHGTHVAGTVGGTIYGVAKAVRLVAVRVLDCNGSGSTSGVIAGVDWVTGDHAAGAPAVANMSLGGGASSALDDAVRRSIADGVGYALAAGNGNFFGIAQDACNSSPARVAEGMTISATDKTDTKASWANYGNCVDWFAPGVGITSAWITSATATNTISGTSMAAPHTAGVAALYLESNPGASAQTVRDALYSFTTKTIVASSNTANNHLLYSLVAGTGGGTNSPPTAKFAYSCTELSCAFTDQSTDSDGTIAQWSWSFGDGASSTAQNPSHSYAAGGTYTVTLTVTDDGGATGTSSQSVTVSAQSSGITLSAVGYKVRGVQKADLTWSGVTSTSVDVWRNGAKIVTTANDGFHTDDINNRGAGSYTYTVCAAGTSTCSNEATVTF